MIHVIYKQTHKVQHEHACPFCRRHLMRSNYCIDTTYEDEKHQLTIETCARCDSFVEQYVFADDVLAGISPRSFDRWMWSWHKKVRQAWHAVSKRRMRNGKN